MCEKILLNNIPKNTEILLMFTLDKKNYEFKVNVLDNNEEQIYLSPIIISNKILNLNNDNIVVNFLWKRKSEKPVAFLNVKLFVSKEKKCYVTNNKKEGKEINRREEFRVFLGFDASFQAGAHTQCEDAIVRDISQSGFSITVNKAIEEALGKPINISFSDDTLNYKFNLKGEIIREQIMDENRIIYGCKFSTPYKQIPKYTNTKQRYELAKHSGTLSQDRNLMNFIKLRKIIM